MEGFRYGDPKNWGREDPTNWGGTANVGRGAWDGGLPVWGPQNLGGGTPNVGRGTLKVGGTP